MKRMKKIKVFYRPEMVVDLIMESPSPRKPLEVVGEWKQKYKVEIKTFSPLTVEDFYLAHDKKHIDGLLNLSIANGMDTKDIEVIDSLPFTTGSLYAGALEALKCGVAVSPTSGFHHAGHDFSWGFCTVNGLLITAIKLIKKNKKVAILDFDYHQGDGSQDIIKKLNLDIVHITGKADYTRTDSGDFFHQLPALLGRLKTVDIILYQAGADQHMDDPLGGFLDNEGIRARDRAVFEFAKSNKIPIVWNLAGGYQESMVDGKISIQKVLDIHNITMEECIAVFA